MVTNNALNAHRAAHGITSTNNLKEIAKAVRSDIKKLKGLGILSADTKVSVRTDYFPVDRLCASRSLPAPIAPLTLAGFASRPLTRLTGTASPTRWWAPVIASRPRTRWRSSTVLPLGTTGTSRTA